MSQNISNPDYINKILSLGKYSPSSHNTQPWTVQINDNVLTIGYDIGRQLKVGDPNMRELFISLGCFIETLTLAANELGYIANCKFLGENPDGIATISFVPSKTKTPEWEKLIKRRRSDRRFYEKKSIDQKIIARLKSLGNNETKLLVYEDTESKDFLAKMTYTSTYEIMSGQEFRDELASWVRNNWTKKPDGMPGYTQGMPGPISLLARFVIKKNKKVAIDQAKKDSNRIIHSSAIGLICIEKENYENWIKAGGLYQRTCLTALANDIKTSGISASIILPKTTKQLIRKLEITSTPVALIRFGYTKNTPKATPRLRVNDFVIN
jgi:hypothetical protein